MAWLDDAQVEADLKVGVDVLYQGDVYAADYLSEFHDIEDGSPESANIAYTKAVPEGVQSPLVENGWNKA